MDRNQGRRLSAEDKLRVVVEGRQSGATISEVCRRHQVDHAQFYRWERLLPRQGSLEALRNGTTRNGKREEWLVSEVNHLGAVVADRKPERGAWFEIAPALCSPCHYLSDTHFNGFCGEL